MENLGLSERENRPVLAAIPIPKEEMSRDASRRKGSSHQYRGAEQYHTFNRVTCTKQARISAGGN